VADTTAHGDATAFSIATAFASLNVVGVNDAPVLDPSKSPVLNAINEDAPAPAGLVGTSVTSLVNIALDNVIDVDRGLFLGIAITAADAAKGNWFYSINGGTSWTPLGAVSDASARLLTAGPNDRLYFKPNADFNGVIASALTFRAWDQASGIDGGVANTVPNGGAT